jgi:hypothetical protein
MCIAVEQFIPVAAVDRSGAAASLVAAREAASDYQPRAAETTVVHRVVRDHLETFLQRAAARSDGAGLPAFVERQLHSVIRCGVLGAGVYSPDVRREVWRLLRRRARRGRRRWEREKSK